MLTEEKEDENESGKIKAGTAALAAALVDHILPFSKSLDDSVANKVVCLREAKPPNISPAKSLLLKARAGFVAHRDRACE